MSGDGDYSKYDLAGLQAELQQERQIKEMLEESVSDLRSTMRDLQDRLHSVDGEEAPVDVVEAVPERVLRRTKLSPDDSKRTTRSQSNTNKRPEAFIRAARNEWKTRYETQIELNGQLQRHISLIHDRLKELRGNPADRLASIRAYDDMAAETLRRRVKLLGEEKSDLQSQLLDCHHRIEQERKAFHKTNDERRAFLSEIAKLSSSEAQRRQFSTQPQRATESKQRSPVRHSTHRAKQASRKVEAELFEGKEREDDGGGVNVKGRGGEKREEKTAQRSRLPTLEHHLKHKS